MIPDRRYNSPLVYRQTKAIRAMKNCQKLAKVHAEFIRPWVRMSHEEKSHCPEYHVAMYERLIGIAEWIELELLLSNKKKVKK